jgi:hypothetical protein
MQPQDTKGMLPNVAQRWSAGQLPLQTGAVSPQGWLGDTQ